MRILIANPNTSETMTERMIDVAGRVIEPTTELVPGTASTGFEYISSRAEAQVAGAALLADIAERIADVDAVVIAAYGDPALTAARELFDVPIVGMAEAAMLTACMLGERFALVTFSETLVPWYLESVARAGLQSRFAGVRTPSAPMASIHTVQDDLRERLAEEVHLAVRSNEADAVILAGAPLAGLSAQMTDTPAVLVDPISAAVKQAELLARISPRGAFTGGFRRPPGKDSIGLPPSLAKWMARG
ncbi:MAG: aspartate/glutamate racemase family protein [Gammaproteobacteria bacterium]|nr:aspartate/glutamate racemase family protein [Gammaproteobacteria bacterium]